MGAEDFYKEHFGHTSQHVSMDKIFVCMELYAIAKTLEEPTFYCPSEIEGDFLCDNQCDHCKEYYAPLENNRDESRR